MVRLQTVSFRRDVVEIIDNFVSVRKICENIGLSGINDQYKKIQADETFNSQFKYIEINGISQRVLCIPYDKINGWLFTINPNRVKPEVRQKLISYKNECFNVLYTYFTKKAKKQIPYQIKRENIELKRAMRRLLNNTDELDRLKEQNTAYYEENTELKRHLQKIKNIIQEK